jgi:3',5'-cyclic AMP phosphodiesterase CpdA
MIQPLIAVVSHSKPDVVAVSGDLTQRARTGEFKKARAFLDALPSPQIVVPGNHDVPFYNPYARFVKRLDKYRQIITEDLEPFFADAEIAVLGINTARSWTVKGGRINEGQVARIRERFSLLTPAVTRFVVTHHPFDLPEGYSERALVGRARMAMEKLAGSGADVFLAGHLHVIHRGEASLRYKEKCPSALVIQAGTATSTRGRGEVNSFNIIRVDGGQLVLEQLNWRPGRRTFAVSVTESFRRTAQGWELLPRKALS